MTEIFIKNPYLSHPTLTPTEADVLWEYAKLAHHVKEAAIQTRKLADAPDKDLLARLRLLEKKMGLVLTLFKASVWGVINEQPVDGSYDDNTTLDTTLRK